MANIQIHELNTHVGALSNTDYLATDNGVNTTKIPVTDISDLAVTALQPALDQIEAEITNVSALVITLSSVSSLSVRYPSSGTDDSITSDLVVLNSVLSNPSAQTDDWTVTTYDGYLTVAGSISGTTNITLYLMKSR